MYQKYLSPPLLRSTASLFTFSSKMIPPESADGFSFTVSSKLSSLESTDGFFSPLPFSSPEPTILLACGRNREALGATISGMRHRCRCAVSRITRIRLFPLFFHIGCSQSSRFLPQARRIVGSGIENESPPSFDLEVPIDSKS